MPKTIMKTWNKFDRWADRYTKVCKEAIEVMLQRESEDFEESFAREQNNFIEDIFIWADFEYGTDVILDQGVSRERLWQRIADRIQLFRGYFMDISFDGAEFMENYSSFLSCQYPSRCNNSFGIWIVQDREKEQPMGYGGMRNQETSFFCKSIEDVDLASMYSTLPFDLMSIRQPKGEKWDSISTKKAVARIKEDLEFDYEVKITKDDNPSCDRLFLNFKWK